MPPVTGTVVKCDDEEQRILIRLGWAVVHWAGLPEGVRQLLVAQATNTGTRMERETVQLERRYGRASGSTKAGSRDQPGDGDCHLSLAARGWWTVLRLNLGGCRRSRCAALSMGSSWPEVVVCWDGRAHRGGLGS
jgi:hypothetical protein